MDRLDDGSFSTPVNGNGPFPDSVPFRGIAVDGTAGYAYYAVNDSTSRRIVRATLSLQAPDDWVTSTGFGIRKIALDLAGRKIYWTSHPDNSIYRADLDAKNSGVEKFLQLDSTPIGIVITP